MLGSEQLIETYRRCTVNLPATYTDINETGCCNVPNVDAWDKQVMTFHDQYFLRDYTRSFFHFPLNMGSVMTKLNQEVEKADAALPAEHSMILSREISPWKAEQLYSVSRPIEGKDIVKLDGTFLTLVFEGPYKDAKKWCDELNRYATAEGHTVKNTYSFYTTCPKCAKHYGKNYVIMLAEI